MVCTVKRKHGCLFLAICVLASTLYNAYTGLDRRPDTYMTDDDLILPLVEQDLPNKQDSGVEMKSGNLASVVVGDCLEVFPDTDEFVNRVTALNVHKKAIHYCGIPKTGTTFTKSLIKAIPKCLKPGVCEINIPSNRVRKKEMPNSTYSFMWVREPYGRLFAGYENKLYHPNIYYWRVVGGRIEKMFREVSVKKGASPIIGYNITFVEFIQYILKYVATGRSGDAHFRPMHTICNPCKTRFDFVGRLESFTESIDQVCRTINDIGLLESENGTVSCSSTTPDSYVFNRIKHLFKVLMKSVPNHSSEGLYKELMQRTWSSYQIRGMVSKSLSMPWSDKELRTVTLDQYVDAVRAAMTASSNTTELRAQRREAMLQAYRTVPRADMALLKKFVSTDCRLFGYEQEPPDLFKATQVDTPSATFDYFNGLLR